jgi:glutamyl-tRNA(Gln) amidotransferase subunit D
MLTEDYKKRDPSRTLILKPEFNEKIVLLKFYPDLNPAVIDWYVEHDFKGIVLEGTGLGHVGSYCSDAIRNAIKHDVVIAMTSQCIWGRINMNVYDSGRDLQASGVIPLEDMLPETAVVKLMWIFGQTKDVEEVKRLLTKNVSCELSTRTLPEKTENE